MMTTRYNASSLAKSKIDMLEFRLKELEATAAEMRAVLENLKAMDAGEYVPKKVTFDPPHPPVELRPMLKKQIIKQPRVKVVAAVPPPTTRATVFTAEVLTSIPVWLEEGLNKQQIADKIGCTLNSLTATCCKKAISLRAKGLAPKVQYVKVEEEVAA